MDVKKQVLTYMKPAKELRKGDRILTGRMTVAEIVSAEAFEDSTKRPCVVVRTRSGKHFETAANFGADESVLVVE